MQFLGQKDITKRVHKTDTRGCKLWPRKQRFVERFELMSLELCDFAINYIFHCSMRPILSTYQDFFKYCFY